MPKWQELDDKGKKTYLTTLEQLFGHMTGERAIPPPKQEKEPFILVIGDSDEEC